MSGVKVNKNEITFKIEKTIAVIDESNEKMLALTWTSWNNQPPKLDFRYWTKLADGTLQPSKGLTMHPDILEKLKTAMERVEIDVMD